MPIKLSGVPAWTEATIPTGSFVATAIPVAGTDGYTLRKVDPDQLGAQGPKGDTGSVILNGAGAPAVGLGSELDYYINTSNGDLYYKAGGIWQLIGTVQGPAGAPGADGADGAVGPAGPAGPAATPGGADTNIQYNDSGSLGGDASFTYDDTNDEMAVDNVKLGVKAESYAATVTLDMREQGFRTLTLAGNLIFAMSNAAAGRSVSTIVTADGSLRTLTFPAGWTFVGSKPTDIAASKVGVLSITAMSTTDASIIAAWNVEE